MNIVVIDKEEGLKVGGIIVYNQRFFQYLTSCGHKITILRFSKKRPKEKYIYRLPYHLAERRSYIVLPSEKALGIIRRYLMKIKPDIVYICAGMSPLDFLIPSICHDLNIPVAGVWHADFNYSLSSLQVLAKSLFLAYIPFCKQLDLLHVFSKKLAKFHIEKGVDRNRIAIIPNGIDPDVYKPGNSTYTRKYRVKTGILFLGRLTLQKNPEILLKTFLDLNPPNSTKLFLVGFGDMEEDLRERYKDKRIIFTGAIKDENKKLDVMRACQIFVLPSRFEGMSLALLEAMSCGLSAVVSDAGANNELIDKAGIVIPEPKLGQQLPLALKLLLDNPEIVRILGHKARQKVLKEYSQEIIFKNLIEAFQSTISDYKKRGSPKTPFLDLDRIINHKLKYIWKKARQFGALLSTEL